MTTAVVAYSATEAALIELSAKYKGVVYDVTTASGMADAKAARNEIRAHRITLDKAREKEKAESLAYGRWIDSEAKRIAERIAELETPIAAMIDAEVNKAKLAEQEAQRIAIEKSAAEEKAKKDAEEAAMAAQRAEIAARQAELDRAERDSRLKIEEEQRAARMKIEEESRQARLAQQARDEVARVKAEQEAAILKAAKDKLDAEQREVQRKANELNDGYEMLATFVRRFGKVGEFIGVAQAIESYLQKTKAAA